MGRYRALVRHEDLRTWHVVNYLYNSQIPDDKADKRVKPGDLFESLTALGVSEQSEDDDHTPDLSEMRSSFENLTQQLIRR